ncbi:hypothetical protein L6R29_12805 [Myxococcota bacterium]|nr:hypothetical protein [Myxococcota bacterium]
MNAATQRLERALRSEESLLAWFEERGYVLRTDIALPLPKKPTLPLQTLYSPNFPKAPRIGFSWYPNFSDRSVKGQRLRLLQKSVLEYCTGLRQDDAFANDAPDLFALGCPDFVLFFPLEGDEYARRLRFSPNLLLREGTALHKHYSSFYAEQMASWAQDDTPNEEADLLDELVGIGKEGRLAYDFQRLFVGEQLDEDFVSLMAMERRELLSILLRPDLRADLLIPMLKQLRVDKEDWSSVALASDGFAPLEQLIQRADIRHRLIASVDTVLLRVVLYRYLEAQFGYQAGDKEREDFAFGATFDEILEKTTETEVEQIAEIRERAASYQAATSGPQPDTEATKPPTKGKKKKGEVASSQLSLFGDAAPVTVNQPEVFVKEVRERNDYYQRQAGGDLHHGSIAEAATFLQEYLLTHHPHGFAGLLVVTRSDLYSFAYADLDPRAFQRFYENTIGTDIRIRYQPDAQVAQIDVVHWHQNRKEQGAYFTNEIICNWLVERSLGVLYEAWFRSFSDFLLGFRKIQRGRMAALRVHLDRLLAWKIMDPTMGGGIFLRAAFEFLSSRHSAISEMLRVHLPEEVRKELFKESPDHEFPYHVFQHDLEQQGEWQWYILLHMLYGVDIDIKAVNIASNLLTLSALIYKPHGVCFPSFINTSLKHGNAFVIPIEPQHRQTFATQYKQEILDLLALRKKLRDPLLSREAWRTCHQQAHAITDRVTNAQILACYKHLFPSLSDKDILQRVRQTSVFLYEIEFPEVFFAPDAQWLPSPGFDVILGNPPWEEPAAEFKHFLPEFDPEYRDLSQAASKVRERELLAEPVIAKRWDTFVRSIEDYKLLLTAAWYQYQRAVVDGRLTGGHSNLYKYATELTFRLLRDGGFGALLLDGGLWNDLSATGLRRMLLDSGRVTIIAGFVNHQGIFPDVHRSYKFACNVFQKGGNTETIRVVFMRETLEDLASFDALAFGVDAQAIRNDPSETYRIPEIANKEQWTLSLSLSKHARLADEPWNLDTLSGDFNAGNQREYFVPKKKGYYPLIQGTQFNLFGVHQGSLPDAWLDPSMQGMGGFLYEKQAGRVLKAIADWLDGQGKLKGGKAEAALDWVAAQTGRRELPAAWVRLDWEGYRIAWRNITNRTNKRTLIAAILPPRIGVSHAAPTIRPFRLFVHGNEVVYRLQYPLEQLLYLAGVLSSFACDSLARLRMSKTNMVASTFTGFHVPVWREGGVQRRVAELTCRLTCLGATEERPWADYVELASVVGMDVERDGLWGKEERREAEAELNALVAGLYGLGREEVRFLMNELFMTKQHREEHGLMRDAIVGWM